MEYPAKGPSLKTYPGIKDVRIPLFALAIFYAGLFFIMGEQSHVDTHRGAGKCFVVRADEKLTAFMELEEAITTRDASAS